jgi:photosystem II stability/assembly factor-like uncharacterized protein
MSYIIACAITLTIGFTAVHTQQAQWESISGPGYGQVSSMITAANGNVLAWVPYGGLYRYDPSGMRWLSVPIPIPIPIPTWKNDGWRFVMGPDRIIYLTRTWREDGGILRSTDHGYSWELLSVPERVWQLAATSLNHLYIAGFHTLYLSKDRGETWRRLGEKDNFSDPPHAFAVDDSGVIFISYRILEGKSTAVYVSRDSVKSWIESLHGWHQFVDDIVIDRDRVAYVRLRDGKAYRSTDAGSTWEVIQNKGHLHVPFDSPVLYAVSISDGVSISSDRGSTWVSSGPLPISRSRPMDAFTVDSTGRYFVGGEQEVIVSDDRGASWHNVSNGLRGYWVTGVTGLPSGTILAGFRPHNGAGHGAFRTTDDGVTWEEMYGDTPSFLDPFSRTPDGTVYCVTGYGANTTNKLFVSRDDGVSWKVLPVQPFGFLARSDGVLFASDTGTFVSRDDGERWSVSELPGTTNYTFSLLAEGRDRVVFGATEQNVYRSTDDGKSWTQFPDVPVGPSQQSRINGLCSLNGVVFIGFSAAEHGVYRSSDNGATWLQWTVDAGVERMVVGVNGHIAVATPDMHIFRSTDEGLTWVDVTSGYKYGQMRSLGMDGLGRILAGSNTGLFRLSDDVTAISPQRPSTPELHVTVYPNPVRGGQFHVAVHSAPTHDIAIVIQDMLGRPVYTASLTSAAPRNYAISVRDLPVGVFVLSARSGLSARQVLVTVIR